MSTNTYTIFQSNVKSQVNGTINIEVKDEAAGSGEANMLIDGNKLGPVAMDNWTCYDDKNKMIWVFYPDAKLERDTKKYQNPVGKQPDLSKYSSAIGYTFIPYVYKEDSDNLMAPPNSGSGTGGGN